MGVAGSALVESPPNVSAYEEDGISTSDQALLHSQLKDSEALCNLDKLFAHLSESRRGKLVLSLHTCS